jgi:hypothetical protein
VEKLTMLDIWNVSVLLNFLQDPLTSMLLRGGKGRERGRGEGGERERERERERVEMGRDSTSKCNGLRVN